MSFHYCICFWNDSAPLIVYPKMSLLWLLMYLVGMAPLWIVPLVFDLMAVTNGLCEIWYEERSCYTYIHDMWNVISAITKCMYVWYKVIGHTQTFTFVIPRKTEANEEAEVKPVRMFPVLDVLRLLRVATSTTIKFYVITVKLCTKNQNYGIHNWNT